MQVTTPKYLKPGDGIRIISTARKVEKSFIEFASHEIGQRGFRVSSGRNLFKSSNQFAGSDRDRLEDLNEAIREESVRAIFCARGGYGTARLLESMDGEAFRRDPKWFVGYSDITALHLHLAGVLKCHSLHATMPVNFETNTRAALDGLFNLLEGGRETYEAPHHSLNRPGETEGVMIGGNLSVLYSLLGSNAQPKTKGCILFLEDLDEYLYHVDRMMLALDRAGLLSDLNGLIIGGMTDMNDNEVPFGKGAEEIISDRVAKYDYPVCFGFPSGHITDNRAWVQGKKIRLSVKNEQPSFIV